MRLSLALAATVVFAAGCSDGARTAAPPGEEIVRFDLKGFDS